MYHVLQWTILRYVKTGMEPAPLGVLLHQAFDHRDEENSEVRCLLRYGTIITDLFTWDACPDLHDSVKSLLVEMRKTLVVRYKPPTTHQRNKYKTYLNNSKFLGKTEEQILVGIEDSSDYTKVALEERLCEPDWFIKLLKKALIDPEWPRDDPSIKQYYLTVNC